MCNTRPRTHTPPWSICPLGAWGQGCTPTAAPAHPSTTQYSRTAQGQDMMGKHNNNKPPPPPTADALKLVLGHLGLSRIHRVLKVRHRANLQLQLQLLRTRKHTPHARTHTPRRRCRGPTISPPTTTSHLPPPPPPPPPPPTPPTPPTLPTPPTTTTNNNNGACCKRRQLNSGVKFSPSPAPPALSPHARAHPGASPGCVKRGPH
jgi:hypothetical protein